MICIQTYKMCCRDNFLSFIIKTKFLINLAEIMMRNEMILTYVDNPSGRKLTICFDNSWIKNKTTRLKIWIGKQINKFRDANASNNINYETDTTSNPFSFREFVLLLSAWPVVLYDLFAHSFRLLTSYFRHVLHDNLTIEQFLYIVLLAYMMTFEWLWVYSFHKKHSDLHHAVFNNFTDRLRDLSTCIFIYCANCNDTATEKYQNKYYEAKDVLNSWCALFFPVDIIFFTFIDVALVLRPNLNKRKFIQEKFDAKLRLTICVVEITSWAL